MSTLNHFSGGVWFAYNDRIHIWSRQYPSYDYPVASLNTLVVLWPSSRVSFFRICIRSSSLKNHLINVSVWLININFSHLWRLSFSGIALALLGRLTLRDISLRFQVVCSTNVVDKFSFGKVVAYEKSWSLNAPYTEWSQLWLGSFEQVARAHSHKYTYSPLVRTDGFSVPNI